MDAEQLEEVSRAVTPDILPLSSPAAHIPHPVGAEPGRASRRARYQALPRVLHHPHPQLEHPGGLWTRGR